MTWPPYAKKTRERNSGCEELVIPLYNPWLELDEVKTSKHNEWLLSIKITQNIKNQIM